MQGCIYKIKYFGIIKLLLILFLSIQTKYAILPTNSNIKALYTGPRKNFIKYVDILKSMNLNALVIDVKDDHGETVFDKNSDRYIKNLKKQIQILKKNNIYLIARIVTFKDKKRAINYPDSCIKTENNNIFIDKEKTYWLNPYNKDNWKYIKDLIQKSSDFGFDEVQLDYIRFSPYLKQENFIKYNPEHLVYKNEIKNIPFVSSKIKKTNNKYSYSVFEKTTPNLYINKIVISRTEILTEFLKEMSNYARFLKIKLSVDVFGCIIPKSFSSYRQNSDSLGQDYIEFSKIVDFISPMIYPSHYPKNSMHIKKPDMAPYNVVFKSMHYSNKYISKTKTRPWIQAFTAYWLKKGNYQKYSKKQLQEQISALEKNGIYTYCIWNPRGRYKEFLN